MDVPRLDPFYEKMAQSGKMIQVHPNRTSAWAEYPTEERSKFELWWALDWKYDLSSFMARIAFSGVFERYPDIKILMHHGGAGIPHFAGRIGPGLDQLGARTPESQKDDVKGYPLTKRLSITSRCSIPTPHYSVLQTRCRRPSDFSESTICCSRRTPRTTRKGDRAIPVRRS